MLLQEKLRKVIKTVVRNELILIANGTLYFKSRTDTRRLQLAISEKWPFATEGQAFRRVTSLPVQRQSAVLVSALGRLGNSIIQILNASSIAHEIGAKNVYFFQFDLIANKEIILRDDIRLKPISFASRDRKRPPDVIWRTDSIFRGGETFDSCSAETSRTAATFSATMGIALPTVGDVGKICTIHLRGGDVFGTSPHPMYGQPPWAFYKLILSSVGWDEVRIVSEDQSNPCLEEIEAWCSHHDVPARRTGSTLEEAILYIVQADNLVLASGSFAATLTMLSQRRKRVFMFGAEANPLVCATSHDVFQIVDKSGRYEKLNMNGGWRNTADQRILMTSYPLESVSWLRDPVDR